MTPPTARTLSALTGLQIAPEWLGLERTSTGADQARRVHARQMVERQCASQGVSFLALPDDVATDLIEQVNKALAAAERAARRYGPRPTSAAGFITVRDAAAQLGCSQDHITDLLRAGDLTGIDVGHGKRRSWRVDPQSLERFIANGRN